jgi:ATP-binding cassette, subfamily B, bacterial PglK
MLKGYFKNIFRFNSKFLYIVAERKYQLIILIILFLISSVLDTVGIGLIGPFMSLATDPNLVHKNELLDWLYGFTRADSKPKFIAYFGILIVCVFYIKSLISFTIQKKVFKFSYGQKGDLSQRLLRGYLAAPYTFHLTRNSASLVQNILQETNNFCNGIMLPFLNSISYSVVIFCLGFLLIKTNVIATFSILVILLIPFLLYQNFKGRLALWGKEASISQVGILRTINHSMGGFKETRIIGCEEYFDDQMSQYIKGFENSVSSAQTFKLLPRNLIEAFLITFLVGFVSLTLFTSQNTQSLTPMLGIFAIASIRLIPAVSQLTNSLASIRNYSHSLNKIYSDLKEIESIASNKNYNVYSLKKSEYSKNKENEILLGSEKTKFNNQIVLNNINYCYPKSPEPSLIDISMTIRKGDSIALIGRSGAGKTTLVDLILGLLDPQSGDIQVDGTSVYRNIRGWQNLIGYIPQSIFLMDDSIERNIAFGVPDHLIDADKLEKAIKATQLEELISDLPDGIKTTVGDRGVRLSGGQRQRIGIARALYHEREILVLDEATSALDNETEKLVTDSISALSGHKTLIIIAHRLSTVESCSSIYRLEKGRIIQSGNYQKITLNKSDLYH